MKMAEEESLEVICVKFRQMKKTRQTSQLLKKQLFLNKTKTPKSHNPHPNVELLNSDKGGGRYSFLYLVLVCVYLNTSCCPSGQLPPALQGGQLTFQEKEQCGQ